MFKNRAITVKFDKLADDQLPDASEEKTFEEKAEAIRLNLEKVCTKMFVGVCVYMLLDTRRQVAVAKALRPK